MADHAIATARKTPIWFWALAVLATLWNFMGVYDYVMTKLGNEAYLAGFTAEQIAYYEGFPAWYVAIWASAVFLAFFASLALLVRSRLAFPMFAASLVLFVVNTLYIYGFTQAVEMMGSGGVVFNVVIFASLVAFAVLSRWGVKAEILR
jgi:hypothetical protein